MYNKKSAAAASKYTQSLYSETGPKSKQSGGDPPKTANDTTSAKPKLSTSDTTKSYTFQPEKPAKKQYATVQDVIAAGKRGELTQQEATSEKVRILGPKGYKQKYGREAPPQYVVEHMPKKEREYVKGKSEGNENRTFLKKPVTKMEAEVGRQQVARDYREGKRTKQERNAGLDSLTTERGMKVDEFKTKVRQTKEKVKKQIGKTAEKVNQKINKVCGRDGCHWVGTP